jgi:hypothetical protein
MAGKKRFLLRIDEQLYAALERWASDELRSVNAQIEYLLTDAARRGGRLRSREEELPAADEPSDEAVGLPPRR